MDNRYEKNENNNTTSLYHQYNSVVNNEIQEKKKMSSLKRTLVIAIVVCSVFSLIVGLGGGYVASMYYQRAVEINSPLEKEVWNPFSKELSTKDENLTENSSIYTSASLLKQYKSVAEIYEDTVDAVVGIVVEYNSGSGWSEYTSTSSGSGVIISEDGYIVTNNHVIANANKITVHLNDKENYQAKLVGRDVQLDLALIKIEAKNLKYMVLGDSDKIVVGEMILVIGNPLGYLSQSLTVGYISGREREITLDNEKMVLLQTDAAVNPGNSGGAMINTNGQLIGIINAKSTGAQIDGIGFAIPINDIKNVLDDIVSYGYVKGRPYLGIVLGDITSESNLNLYNMMYGLKLSNLGVYVSAVQPDSAAARAGMKEWDYISSFDKIKVESGVQLKELVEECVVGQMVEVVIIRGEETITLMVEIGEEIPTTGN